MAMRDFFKGNRDRDNDRWREQWRDDRYPQRYSSGYGRDDQRGQRGPQFYGQSGRADWADPNNGSRQRGSRDDEPSGRRNENSWSRQRDSGRNEQYHGGFYAGETGRESMYRTEPSGQGDWGRDSQRWNDRNWNRSENSRSGGRDDWRPFESQSQFETSGEHRGRGPKGYQRSDQRIHEDVCECLTDDHFIDASNIEITVQSGIVTLTGTVNSRQQKRRAEDLIESLSGVKDINNSLRVADQTESPQTESYQSGSRESGSRDAASRTSQSKPLESRPGANEQTSRH